MRTHMWLWLEEVHTLTSLMRVHLSNLLSTRCHTRKLLLSILQLFIQRLNIRIPRQNLSVLIPHLRFQSPDPQIHFLHLILPLTIIHLLIPFTWSNIIYLILQFTKLSIKHHIPSFKLLYLLTQLLITVHKGYHTGFCLSCIDFFFIV